MAFTLGSLFLLCGICGLLTGVSSAPVKAFYCPNDWTLLKSSCYIYQAESRTFSDAESVCIILGGNLVSIHDGLENAFVLELIRAADGEVDEAWIGYSDAIMEGDFIWTDGSDNSFQNFGAGEPDSDDCISMDTNDGEWQDEECDDTFPYVCIMDASHH
ncbi:galactose-specific lectin nattectin-like [Syngnathus scovelli]|uniref:galactose-specific lectin nattectin-like n=1 Tax=Syngnathus scovelli TaxID=161590 RepID=UPI00210FA9EE|nr:galactose-specific lectin nattectin-like [Syngnathus scovelli]